MTMSQTFIAIAGNIGAGKTTLTEMLGQKFNWTPYFESVSDNPYLADFYTDMERWAFPLQIHFLNHRFEAHRGVCRSGHASIQDRSIYEDAHIFAKNLHDTGKMSSRDYANYLKLYNTMIPFLKPPTLLVFVQRSVPNLMRNIQKRGRDYESGIPQSYIEQLNENYRAWSDQYNLGGKLILDLDGVDFVRSSQDFASVCALIENALKQESPTLNTAPSMTHSH